MDQELASRLNQQDHSVENNKHLTDAVGCCVVDNEIVSQFGDVDIDTPFCLGSVSKLAYALAFLKIVEGNSIDLDRKIISFQTGSYNEVAALYHMRKEGDNRDIKSVLEALSSKVVSRIRLMIPTISINRYETLLSVNEVLKLTLGYSMNDSLLSMIDFVDNGGYVQEPFKDYTQEYVSDLLKGLGIDQPRFTIRGASNTSGEPNTGTIRECVAIIDAISSLSPGLGLSVRSSRLLLTALSAGSRASFTIQKTDLPEGTNIVGKVGYVRNYHQVNVKDALLEQFVRKGNWKDSINAYYNLLYVGIITDTNGDRHKVAYAVAVPETPGRNKNDNSGSIPQEMLLSLGEFMKNRVLQSIHFDKVGVENKPSLDLTNKQTGSLQSQPINNYVVV